MNNQLFNFSSLTIILIFLTLNSCDTKVTQPEEVTEIQLILAPVNFVSNSSKKLPNSGNFGTTQKKSNPAAYYCITSTLNPASAKWAYRINRFD